MIRSVAGLVLALLLMAPGEQDRPIFRSRADAVIVDVLVRDGKRTVGGLSKDDFQLFDQGWPQQIDEVLTEQLPIDLTLLLDASGSTAAVIDRFKANAVLVAGMLRDHDRVRVTAFATEAADAGPLAAAPSFAIPPVGVTTALNDALLLTLARSHEPGRRHLVVAYTDGIDTASVNSRAVVNAAARHTESVMYLVLPLDVATPARFEPEHVRMLREAAEATGGGVTTWQRGTVEALQQVFADFRESYVLRYSPRGVPFTGWHEISVRVMSPAGSRYTVRARRGYFAGAR